MQTAQAIQALKHLEMAQEIHPEKQQPSIQPVPLVSETSALEVYQNQLLEALLQRDLNKADLILGEALAVSPPDEIILRLIGPTLSAVGDAWENHQISVAVEHLVTNFLRQRLLMWMVSGPPPQPVPPVILSCAPNEFHEGSLLILGALLRRRRWPVAYLGQAVPLSDLATFIREIKPSCVVLVAMTESSAAELAEWPQYIPEITQTGKPILCYGGRVFVKHREWTLRVPGIYLGDTLEEGLHQLEGLMTKLSKNQVEF